MLARQYTFDNNNIITCTSDDKKQEQFIILQYNTKRESNELNMLNSER